MNKRKYRILIVASHPVQYAAPLFRLMAEHPQLDIQVAYCSLQGAEPGIDSGFGIEVAWDIPLLDGYPWVLVPNQSSKPGLVHFFGLVNTGLRQLINTGSFDAVIALTGYAYASFWIAAMAAKIRGIPILFGTDAWDLSSRTHQTWKIHAKKLLLPIIFRLADIVIVLSSGGKELMRSLGIANDRVSLTPYVVDNAWWLQQAKHVSPSAVRQQWDIPERASVVVFCAKFQPWKRPHDVIRAFAKAKVANSYLVMVGEGPLRKELEIEAENLHISNCVRFLGFINQSQLPTVYCSADLLVFPSEYEPFGVVVNEAMLCGCPVVASDRIGARFDLIEHGKTGFIYPCGDIDTLADILQLVLPDHDRLHKMGIAATERMNSWSPRENVEAIVRALEKSITS